MLAARTVAAVPRKESMMGVAKIIEIIGTSNGSWEEAAQAAVRKAAETIHSITGVEVVSQTATVRDGAIQEYKTTVHVAFALDE
jgi:hypothetical protein